MQDESIRPWGHYEILSESSHSKVKQITVKPNKRLSYQYHHHRSEIWIIVSGSGIFTLDGQTSMVTVGDTLRIPVETRHRIENNSQDQDLVFIEVQRGTYFGEDDIIRIEDDFDRK